MRRSSRVWVVCLPLVLLMVSACRGCRAEPPTAPVVPKAAPRSSAAPPNIKMDYGKALDAMDGMFGTTLYPGDCKPGTGPASLENKSDRDVRPPCERTEQYYKRREAAQKKKGTP